MSKFSDETLDLSTATISDLILVLRSAFQQTEFDRVEQILSSRETRLAQALSEWKLRYETMEKKHGIAMVDKIKAEHEAARCRRQMEVVKDRVEMLLVDNRMLDGKATVFEGRERKARNKAEELAEEFERVECERIEMVGSVYEAESKRVEAEREVEWVKKEMELRVNEADSKRVESERELERVERKNKELELRVCALEEAVDLLKNEEKEDSTNDVVVANRTLNGAISGNSNGAQVKNVVLNGREKGSESVHANDNRVKRKGTGFGIHPCNEGQTALETGGCSHRDKRQKRDTADQTPTQNQAPNVPNVALPDGGNQGTSSSQKPRPRYLGVGDGANGKYHCYSPSSSSESSCDTATMYELLKQRRGK